MYCIIECCKDEIFRGPHCRKHYWQIRRHGEIQIIHRFTPNEFIIHPTFCEIICRNRHHEISGRVLIDLKNIGKCKDIKWCITKAGYVWNNKIGYLHRFLLPDAEKVDHRNRNKLDCREDNLRAVTSSQNSINTATKSNNTSGFKGVKIHTCTGKWQASICDPLSIKGYRYLGLFTDKRDAALAYNKAAKEIYGEFAYLNPVLIRRKNEHSINGAVV